MPGPSRTPLRSTRPVEASGTRATPHVLAEGSVGSSMTESGSGRGEESPTESRPVGESHTAARVRVGGGVSSGPEVQISVVLNRSASLRKSRGVADFVAPTLLVWVHIVFLSDRDSTTYGEMWQLCPKERRGSSLFCVTGSAPKPNEPETGHRKW